MFHDKNIFTELKMLFDEKIVTRNPKSNLVCKGRGTVEILINDKLIKLKDCLYVPEIMRNLVSLLELCNKSITITTKNKSFHLSQNNQILLSGHIINKLMIVTFDHPSSFLTKIKNTPPWHQRLGHPGNHVLKSLGLFNLNELPCNVCSKGKMTTLPFKGHFTEAIKPLDCLHLDVVGPISPPSKYGYRYFLTIIYQHTSFKITRFLKQKSEVFGEFVIQQKYLENLHDRKVKKLVTDGGGEFVNQNFKELADTCGMIHIVSPPYTPEHNGFSERANKTTLDKARCLLINSNLPNQSWAEAIRTATFLTNVIPTASRKNYSPWFLWNNTSPKIKKIRTFGCKISDNKVYYSRHIVFFEHKFPSLKENTVSNTSPLNISWNDFYEEEYFDCQESMEEEERVPTIQEATDLLENDTDSLSDCTPPVAKRIKVIGSRHPTLINSDIREENILPYPRRPVALYTQNDPLSYYQAIRCPCEPLRYDHIPNKVTKKTQNNYTFNIIILKLLRIIIH
ncbi:hypothetical protein O181_101926 [Austropuccinia psidii MF-1]|uniref:Integrase catalytic domain-containing protein n=1 Tax=Austropuccinia psidii MF-1 TaxID=1389203 RepID=A0A9Q3JHQ1_9BASI|nr:hypothetical protein [Austropuccinia psidii MF-1]